MTISLLVLVSVIVMGVGTAVLLVQRSCDTDPLPDSKTLEAEMACLERHRFLRQPDCEDAAQRRRLIREQLIELRRDFLRFWRICRLLAPYSQEPDFAVVLVRQLALFHRLWIPLWIGSYGWALERAVQDLTLLVDSVELLGARAQEVTDGAERAAFEQS